MEVEMIITGTLDENCYVLKKNNTSLVIDPGDDYDKIKEKIGEEKVLAVLITHSHFDHVGALRNFLKKKSIKIFKKSNTNENTTYTIGDFSFRVLYTPGHSSDSISFYFEDDQKMFVGDFIFKSNIGRCDLPTGSEKDMQKSLEKIKNYPNEIILYTGHGEATTLEQELKTNPYLNERE